jgi:hypothetical protein
VEEKMTLTKSIRFSLVVIMVTGSLADIEALK